MRVVAILLLLLFLLGGCAKAPPVYADDVSCEALMEAVEKQIPVEFGYAIMKGEELRAYVPSAELPEDYCLRYSTLSENINEIGILHTESKEEQAAAEALCEAYLKELWEEKQAFIASYAPEELPKLEHAEVRSFGRYTVYAILDDDDRTRIFDAIEQLLTPK